MDLRTLMLMMAVMAILPLSLAFPYVGVLAWGWISFLNPHREVWGFGAYFQWNFIIAAITIGGWLISREPKRIPICLPMIFLGLFTVWTTIATFQAADFNTAYVMWDRHIKVTALVVMVAALCYKKTRLLGFVGVIVLSIGYWGIKGGLTLIGGGSEFTGPARTAIGDRNHLALAVALSIPLINFFRIHLTDKWLSLGMQGAMLLSAMAVVVSQSRGGFVALAVAAIGLWYVSKRKAAGAVIGALGLGLIVILSPEGWLERIQTIQDVEEDGSFQGRLDAWRIAINIANERVFGLGPQNIQNPAVVAPYIPPDVDRSRAAHSIYFEVLGDSGWIGLLLFVGYYIACVLEGERAKRIAKRYVEMAWIFNLARMIQISLAVYAVGGGLLSLAYWGIPLSLGIMLYLLRKIAERSERELMEATQKEAEAQLQTLETGQAANDAEPPDSRAVARAPRERRRQPALPARRLARR